MKIRFNFPDIFHSSRRQWRWLVVTLFLAVLLAIPVVAATSMSTSEDGRTLYVDDAPEMRVIAFSKTVIIRKRVKEVFVWGGDVRVEGDVDGDVAVIGGSVVQTEGASIGGAVIVFGGSYRPESRSPLRGEGKETVVLGMFEEELRGIAENPSQIFAPSFSLAFLAQRLVSVLFWFIVTFGVATIAPGAVSRSIARFHLFPAKVFAIGLFVLLLTIALVIAGVGVMPDYLTAIFGLMILALLMLAYGFGRVTLQMSLGKLMQKRFFAEDRRSDALAAIIGVFIWVVLLSVPYLWTLAVIALFGAGIGLVLTARSNGSWKSG